MTKQYKYTGPITAFEFANENTVTVSPNQLIDLDETDPYVIRLVERGLLVNPPVPENPPA